jgi:hypothetical protein
MNGPALTEEEFFRGMPQIKPSNELQQRILDKVDKIVITQNVCRADTPPAIVMANPEDVAKFIAQLEIDETAELYYCMCSGEWRIEFFANDQLKTSYTLHHAITTRSEFWWGNATLLKPQALLESLANLGLSQPLDQFLSDKRRREADQLAEERWIEFSPKCFSKYREVITSPSENDFAAIVNEMSTEIPDRRQQIRALLQAYGQVLNSWKCHAMFSGIMTRLLGNYETSEVAQAYADSDQNQHLKAGLLLFLKPDEMTQTKERIITTLPKEIANDLERSIQQFQMPTSLND